MKLDMHCHVREGSVDSRVSLDEYITTLKEKGFDGEIAKYMREHTNTAIVGDVPGVDRHVIRYRTHKDWTNYKNPYSTK